MCASAPTHRDTHATKPVHLNILLIVEFLAVIHGRLHELEATKNEIEAVDTRRDQASGCGSGSVLLGDAKEPLTTRGEDAVHEQLRITQWWVRACGTEEFDEHMMADTGNGERRTSPAMPKTDNPVQK